jgi:hypothetical protein
MTTKYSTQDTGQLKNEAKGLNINGAVDIKKYFILSALNYAVSDINVESFYKCRHNKNTKLTENKV